MTLSLPRKYSASGTTIFTQMSALAQQYNAINLSQGFPDFEADPTLGDLLLEASRNGFNQYAPMAGLPGLREEISRHVRHTQAVIINPDTEITLTLGATCAIYTALATVLQTGDD